MFCWFLLDNPTASGYNHGCYLEERPNGVRLPNDVR